jgi:acetyl esterase/lipase
MTPPDPQARSLLEAMKASGQPLSSLCRSLMPASQATSAGGRPAPRPDREVEDDLVPGPLGGIPARWCRPGPEGGLPVTLYFHGGGWTVADALRRGLA